MCVLYLNFILFLTLMIEPMLLYTDLPAIKYTNVVELASEMASVMFPFRHAVMETGLLANVSPSPVNE